MSEYVLKFQGAEASNGELDFYDAAKAMMGFQRSLALTTHLALNGEIITQSPSLKNARILARPPREGSWEIIALLLAAAGGMLIAPKDSVAGHFTRSMYDYVLKSLFGIDVDFDKTIRLQYADLCAEKKITQEKMDSLAEKIEPSVIDMHRPIVFSNTASIARISEGTRRPLWLGPPLTRETYEYVSRTVEGKHPEIYEGMISSYNSNTFKGRIFVPSEARPIPFELADSVRDNGTVTQVTMSLSLNAIRRVDPQAKIAVRAFRRESTKGRLKGLYIVDVAANKRDLR